MRLHFNCQHDYFFLVYTDPGPPATADPSRPSNLSPLPRAIQRPKTGDALCRECFFWAFETEVHNTVTAARLFRRGQYVAVAASGGKDSTVLAHVMKELNQR